MNNIINDLDNTMQRIRDTDGPATLDLSHLQWCRLDTS